MEPRCQQGLSVLLSGQVISPAQRPLPHNIQHSKETDIHAPAVFEPAIPASKRPQTHSVERAGTGIGTDPHYLQKLYYPL